MDLFNTNDYRAYLRGILESRQQKNAGYSLRAFARDLEMLPSQLSEIMAGKKGLSVDGALRVSRHLGMTGAETQMLVDLVESQHSRSPALRKAAEARVRCTLTNDFSEIRDDVIALIAEWYHSAIIEMTAVNNVSWTPAGVAHRLSISVEDAEAALDRLVRLGFIRQQGRAYVKAEARLTTSRDIPSAAIRAYHENLIKKSLEALHIQKVEHREFESMVVATSHERVAWAKRRIQDFVKEVMIYLEDAPEKDTVYAMGVQLFELLGRQSAGSERAIPNSNMSNEGGELQ